jgi:hypothetical protein
MSNKKTAAQLDREIAELAPSATTPHSAKALMTLRIMGTAPPQWRLTPIEWVEEEREVVGLVRCPTCHGGKFVRIEDGRVLPPPPSSEIPGSFDYKNAARRDAFRVGLRQGNCPTCAKRKAGWGMIPQGKVAGKVRAKVMVGYPKFPPGTRFDSRFFGGLHCNLCNKVVLRSRRVPVHAIGDDGVAHGMWVGEDCARKFLDVRLSRAKDSIMEDGDAAPTTGDPAR